MRDSSKCTKCVYNVYLWYTMSENKSAFFVHYGQNVRNASNTYIWHRKKNAACEFLWPCFDVGSLWVFLAKYIHKYTDLSSYCICYICFLVVYSNPWDTLLGKTNNMSRWDILFCSINQKLFSGNSTGWWLLLLSKKSF